MRGKPSRLFSALFLILCAVVTTSAQKGQSANQTGQQAQGGGQSAQGLQGLLFSPAEWDQLKLPDVAGPAFTFKDGRMVLCFRLAKGNSATQPFVLERVQENEVAGSGFYRPCGDDGKGETDSEGRRRCGDKEAKETGHWSACSALKSPTLGGQVLVIGVDVSDLGATGINFDQLKLLNLNITNQQGAALNPSPIRASFPTSASSGGGGGQAGSPGGMEDTQGRGTLWVPVGTHTPEGSDPQRWSAYHKYKKNEVVTDSSGNYFYVAESDFISGPAPIDPFPPQPQVERVLDGDIVWQEITKPKMTPPDGSIRWVPSQSYETGDVVCVPRSKKNNSVSQYSDVLYAPVGFRKLVTCESEEVTQDSQAKASAQAAHFLEPLSQVLEEFRTTFFDIHARYGNDAMQFSTHLDQEASELSKTSIGDAPPEIRQAAVELLRSGAALVNAEGGRSDSQGGVLEAAADLRQHAAELLGSAADLLKSSPTDAQKLAAGMLADAAIPLADAAGLLIRTIDPAKTESDISIESESKARADHVLTSDLTGILVRLNDEVNLKSEQIGAAEPNGRIPSQQLAELLKTAVVALQIDELHLHYYKAIKGGVSGSVPYDPISLKLVPRAIYLTWPYQLPGDVIPSFSVNLVYTPPVPGAQWQGNTFYPAGSVVTSASNPGHFYTAVTGGTSGSEPDEPHLPLDVPPTVQDGDLVWLDSGTTPPTTPAKGQWMPVTAYHVGDVIGNLYNGHYYTMFKYGAGLSGVAPNGSADPFPNPAVSAGIVQDGDISWIEMGTAHPSSKFKAWGAKTKFALNDIVLAGNSHYYRMIKSDSMSGVSGSLPESPFLPVQSYPLDHIADGTILWIKAYGGATAIGPWVPRTHYQEGQIVYGSCAFSQRAGLGSMRRSLRSFRRNKIALHRLCPLHV